MPFCKCGCGQETKQMEHSHEYCKYIKGHQSKKAQALLRGDQPPDCACGCGGKVVMTKRKLPDTVWNKYIPGHQKAHLGHRHSEQAKKMMSEKASLRTGEKNPFFGRKHSEKTRFLISQNHADFKGDKSPSWKGGFKKSRDPDWTKIRSLILFQTGEVCKKCGKHGNNIHHIIPYRITQDNSDGNLVVLCFRCHMIEERAFDRKFKGPNFNLDDIMAWIKERKI